MRKLIVGAIFAIVALPVPAHATEVTQFAWDRTGAENLPCAGEQHWRLSPASGINDGVGLGFNDDDGIPDGESFSMIRDEDSFTAYVPRPLIASDEVLVAFAGEAAVQPTLSLVDCVEAVTEPPPIPTTNPPSTPPTESQPAPTLVSWEIGFRVRTIRRTNVLAKWRIVCDGVLTRGKVRAMTPLSRTFTGFEGATTCHITVRAYDIKPHVRPHNWPAPVVTTFVNHS